MAHFHPTPLDLALAENPSAEADSRAIAEAATPPNWTQLDLAANQYAAAFDEGRRKLKAEMVTQDIAATGQRASAA